LYSNLNLFLKIDVMIAMNATYTLGSDWMISIEKKIASFLYRFIHIVSTSPWIVAFALLSSIGFLYTISLYFPLKYFRKSNSRRVDEVLSNMKSIDERNAMLLHSKIEELSDKLEYLIDKAKFFFVFRPLISEFSKVQADLKRAERGLFDYIYPEYEKDLTREEVTELIEAFRPWKQTVN
jgi:hypothetical protein